MTTAIRIPLPARTRAVASDPEPSTGGRGGSAITVAGRRLQPSPVFDTYWRFAAARQNVYQARLRGEPGPWTDDPILSTHRFTNCFRAADRVSQYLISQVIYAGPQDVDNVFFRTLLFKIFNRTSTWQLFVDELGEITWDSYDFCRFNAVLGTAFASGRRLYSAAYVIPPPNLGEARKHTNHLRLLELMMATGAPRRTRDAGTMARAFAVLREYPAIGDFLAYQYVIDLAYSSVFPFDESEFVAAGPGARDGIRKCFGLASTGIEADVIAYMADSQQYHFQRLGLRFEGLGGLRPLQLIDCQNLFCEVDKYARIAHPEIVGHSGRTRIKQRFAAVTAPVAAWFPPRWGLNNAGGSNDMTIDGRAVGAAH